MLARSSRRVLAATAFTLTVGLFLAGCSETPTSPAGAFALRSIAPSPYVWSTSTQTMTVTGDGFLSGITLTFTKPDNTTSVLSAAQLQNLTDASFQLPVRFAYERIGT